MFGIIHSSRYFDDNKNQLTDDDGLFCFLTSAQSQHFSSVNNLIQKVYRFIKAPINIIQFQTSFSRKKMLHLGSWLLSLLLIVRSPVIFRPMMGTFFLRDFAFILLLFFILIHVKRKDARCRSFFLFPTLLPLFFAIENYDELGLSHSQEKNHEKC